MNETSKTSKTSNSQRTRKARAGLVEARAISMRGEIAGLAGRTGRTTSSPLDLILANFAPIENPRSPVAIDVDVAHSATAPLPPGLDANVHRWLIAARKNDGQPTTFRPSPDMLEYLDGIVAALQVDGATVYTSEYMGNVSVTVRASAGPGREGCQ